MNDQRELFKSELKGFYALIHFRQFLVIIYGLWYILVSRISVPKAQRKSYKTCPDICRGTSRRSLTKWRNSKHCDASVHNQSSLTYELYCTRHRRTKRGGGGGGGAMDCPPPPPRFFNWRYLGWASFSGLARRRKYSGKRPQPPQKKNTHKKKKKKKKRSWSRSPILIIHYH